MPTRLIIFAHESSAAPNGWESRGNILTRRIPQMSNRVRILFHCELEGPQVCHMGNRALRAMEALVRNRKGLPAVNKEYWISEEEWKSRGRQAFLKKALHLGPFGQERKYLMARKTENTPAEPPLFKN